MEQNPNSPTVKGLNIAILVLSILSLVCAIGLCATGVVAINVMADGRYISNAVTSANVYGYTSDTVESLKSIDTDVLDKAARSIKGLSSSQFQQLSAKMDQFDQSGIASLLKSTGVANGLTDAQTQGLAYLIAMSTATSAASLADDLESISTHELHQYIEDIEDTMSSYYGDQIVKSGSLDEATRVGGIAIISVLFVLIAIGLVVSLIASILGIRNAFKPEKLGPAFVMAIIGAVLALFSGRLVTMVLHIIAAVKTHSVQRSVRVNAPEASAPTSAPEPPAAVIAAAVVVPEAEAEPLVVDAKPVEVEAEAVSAAPEPPASALEAAEPVEEAQPVEPEPEPAVASEPAAVEPEAEAEPEVQPAPESAAESEPELVAEETKPAVEPESAAEPEPVAAPEASAVEPAAAPEPETAVEEPKAAAPESPAAEPASEPAKPASAAADSAPSAS